jgi:hypothetical protein
MENLAVMKPSDPSVPLAAILLSTTTGLVRTAGAPVEQAGPVRRVVIADADNLAAGLSEGSIVLAIGLPYRATRQLVEFAVECDASAVALRTASPAASRALSSIGRTLGITLLELAAGHTWDRLHRELTAGLSPPPVVGDDALGRLAQTIAALTRGSVTIEDPQARVLAYSSAGDEVDDLRRRSILGRSGPPEYLTLLRDLGVYDRLAAGDLVDIAHPQHNIRRRLAIGIFAGSEPLGTIWVLQGGQDLSGTAAEALRGAARIAAEHIAGRGTSHPVGRVGGALLDLLVGRSTAQHRWVPTERPFVVAAFAFGDESDDPAAGTRRLDRLAGIVRIHAAAFRPDAEVAEVDNRLYLLVPNISAAVAARSMLGMILTAARDHVAGEVHVAVGPVVLGVDAVAASRQGADLVLDANPPDNPATFDDLRAFLLAGAAASAVARRVDLHDQRLARLVTTKPELARTLLVYLDHASVSAAAAHLQVHPTSVRQRLHRLAGDIDLDLSDPEQRLAAQLQLRATADRQDSPG